jgi:dihydrofolate reductase
VKTIVVSRTLRHADHPKVTIFSDLNRDWIEELRAQSGKDIWLFGGGELFRSMLEMGEVDKVEVAIMPVLLGGGIALLPSIAQQTKLSLSSHKLYRSGIVSLVYEVKK